MTENAKISALQHMLFERGLIITQAINYKNYFIILTRDTEGLMLRRDFSIATYAVLLILKCVRKSFSLNFGAGKKKGEISDLSQ